MALAPLGAMAPLEMNEGTHYFQGGTKGLSVRPRCIGAAWFLPFGSLLITDALQLFTSMHSQGTVELSAGKAQYEMKLSKYVFGDVM
jgi:hypothetical protein